MIPTEAKLWLRAVTMTPLDILDAVAVVLTASDGSGEGFPLAIWQALAKIAVNAGGIEATWIVEEVARPPVEGEQLGGLP